MIDPLLLINGTSVPTNDKVIDEDKEKYFEQNTQLRNEFITGIPQIDWDKYTKYGIVPNRISTIDELNKERAKNQTVSEQLRRGIGQAVVNETLLATIKGFSDIIDGIATTFSDETNDYTNPVSQQLEEWQDKLKEEWEIYRTNPDKNFDLGNSGWWMNNLVNVATTLGLLIPSTTIDKVLSFGSKVTKLNRVSTKAANAVSKLSKEYKTASRTVDAIKKEQLLGEIAAKSARTGKFINNATKIGIMTLSSRIAENYQEARETYKNNYDIVLNGLNNMEEAQRQNFLYRNNLKDDTNENLAKQLAGQTAKEVYDDDMKLILLDALQFATISKGLKGFKIAGRNTNLFTKNEKALSQLKGLSKETIEKLETTNAFKSYLKNTGKHFGTVLQASEISEGFEEGYQGIVQARATDIAKHAVDKNYNERSLSALLNDGSIWEQAVWGWIGGLVFKGAGIGLEKLSNKIETNIEGKRKNLSPEDIAKLRLTEAEILDIDLENRVQLTNQFINDIEKLNQNINPLTKKYNYENGKFEEINENIPIENDDEKELIYQQLVNEYTQDMILNAADNGTADMLLDWINNPAYQEALQNAGASNTLYTKLKESMQNTLDRYYNEIYKIEYNTKDKIENPFISRIIARQQLRAQDETTNETRSIDIIDDLINQQDSSLEELEYESNEIKKSVNAHLTKLLDIKDNLGKSYNNNEITKTSYDNQLYNINKQMDRLLVEFGSYTDRTKSIPFKSINDILSKLDKEEFKNLNDKVNKFIEEYQTNIGTIIPSKYKPSTKVKELVKDKIDAFLSRNIADSQILRTQEDYERAVDEFQYLTSESAKEKIDNAEKLVKDYFDKSDNPNQAKEEIFKEENLSPELKNAVKILQLSARDDFNYNEYLDRLVAGRAAELAGVIPSEVAQQKEEITTASEEQSTQIPIQSILPKGDKQNQTQTTTTTTATEEIVELTEAQKQDLAKAYRESNPLYILGKEENPFEEMNNDIIVAIISNTTLTSLQEFLAEKDSAKKLNDILTNENKWSSKQGKTFIDDIIENCINVLDKKFPDAEFKTVDYEENVKIIKDIVLDELKTNGYRLIKENQKDAFKDSIIDLINGKIELSSATRQISISNSEKVENFINEYIKKYNELNPNNKIIRNKEGKYIIDVDKLFKFILEQYDDNYTVAKRTFNLVKGYINNNIKNAKNNNPNSTIIFDNYYNFLKNKDFADNYFEIITAEPETIIEQFHTATPSTIKKIINKIKRNQQNINDEIIVFRRGHYEILNNNKNNITDIDITQLNNYIKALNRAKQGNKLVFVDMGYSISVRCPEDITKSTPNDEIAFLAKTKYNKTNTKQSQIINDSNNKIYFEIEKTINGYTSPTDKLIVPIMDYIFINKGTDETIVKLSNLIKEYHNNHTVENIPNEIIQYLKNQSFIGEDKNNIKDFGIDIIKQLHDIIYYGEKYNIPYEEAYQSYLIRLYKNYNDTNTIQKQLEENKDKIITGNLVSQERYIIDKIKEPYDVSYETIKKHLNPAIVYVNEDGLLYTEGQTQSKANTPHKSNYNMGIEVIHKDNHPGIIWFKQGNKLSEDLIKDVSIELNNILNTYLEHSRTNNFERVYEELSELFGNSSLFHNIRIVKSSDKNIIYLINETDETSPIIAIYRTDAKNKSLEGGISIINKQTNQSKNILVKSDKRIDEVVGIIANGLIYNRLRDGVITNTRKQNKYFTKTPDGKFIINIANKTYTYDSYLDFVLTNSAFKTDDIYYENSSSESILDIGDVYVTVDNVTSPVKGFDIKKQKTVDELVKNSNYEKPINVIELLKAANVPNSVIDTLITPIIDNNSTTTLIPNNIYYVSKHIVDNKEFKDYFFYDGKSDKIFITQNGKTLITSYNDKTNGTDELIRNLLHENIHKQFANKTNNEKAYIVSQVLDIYKQFVEALDEDKSSNNTQNNSIQIRKFVEESAFSKNRYEEINKLDHNSKEYGELLSEFANEFLAESLTQPALVEYLDNREYRGNNIAAEENITGNKTIWQKIIDILYRIFTGKNLDISKNNSIFAQLYKSLSVDVNKLTISSINEQLIEKIDNLNKTEDNTKKVKTAEELFNETDEINEELMPDVDLDGQYNMSFDFPNGELSSKTKLITTTEILSNSVKNGATTVTNGLKQISDMNAFADMFENEDKLKIAKMIGNGEILYVC